MKNTSSESQGIKFLITGMKWERIFLDIRVETDCNENFDHLDFEFVKMKKTGDRRVMTDSRIPVRPEKTGKGFLEFSINMTDVKDRMFLDNGHYMLMAVMDADKVAGSRLQNKENTGEAEEENTENYKWHLGYEEKGKCYLPFQITAQEAYKLDDHSRVFRYGSDKFAYTLSFTLESPNDVDMQLIISSFFMTANNGWKKRRYRKEGNTVKGRIKNTYKGMVVVLIRWFYNIFSRVTPKNGTRVLFMSETKDYLWGNLKYIDSRMKERGLDKNFKISYSCRKAVGGKNSIFNWIKTVFLIAKQDYIFVDDYAPVFGFFKLHPKSKLIQVWHAGIGFKSVGYSRFGKDGSPFPTESCHRAYDYALTGSEMLIKAYQEVFGIEREAFFPSGLARLDDFLDENHIRDFKEEFYREHPYLKNRKIILFAPTYRGKGQKEAFYDYSKLDLHRIWELCGDEWAFVVKMHPFIDKLIEIPEKYSDRIFDLTDFPNINDLYYVSDILVTDYSSSYYEFSLLRKPILFYTYDREFYELTRGVHREILECAPGKVCDTFDEFMEALENEDYQFEKTLEFADENFRDYDGKASDRVIDKILLGK